MNRSKHVMLEILPQASWYGRLCRGVTSRRTRDRGRERFARNGACISSHDDATARTQSKGRLYAFDSGRDILDPAMLPEGTPITLVGEVTGSATGSIGEGAKYQYPTVNIKI